jgi:two-component system, chemotaxis family, sensor kinase CheA
MSLEETRKKLLNKFKEEADIHLLTLQRRLVDLELDPQNNEYLREVFRAAHTIKGSARLMNFLEISSIAHEMENIFAEMREGRLQLQPETNDLLFEAIDTINTMIEAALRGEKTVNLDVASINKRLAAILKIEQEIEATAGIPAPAQPLEKPAEIRPDSEKPAELKMADLPETVIPQPVLRQVGALSDNVIRVDVGKLDELMNIAGELVLGKMQAETTLNALRALHELFRTRQRVYTPVRNLLANGSRDINDVSNWIEVRDALLQLGQLDQHLESIVKNTLRDYEEHTSQLVNRVDELENTIKSVRMLPIETIYQDFPVAVRAIAKSNGREIAEFRQLGGEIELDKKVLEGIKDPLIHIIRNALDHGIKTPQERLAAGKPRAGRLTMSASQDGGYVSIQVSDDGAGMDPNEIRQVAIKKKFLTEAKAVSMSDEDILNLIYEPGFSTSPIITDLSGRGVGMEIVKTNLERLGGQVHISSQKEVGTTVTLRVPVTLATSRALLVRVGGNLYSILAPAIEAMLYLQPEDIFSREGRDVTLYRKALVPLVKLEDLLGSNRRADHPLFRYQANVSEQLALTEANNLHLYADSNNGALNSNGHYDLETYNGDGFTGLTLADPKANSRIREMMQSFQERNARQLAYDRLPAVVVGSGDRRVCFLVDELVDETEIVVKSLSPMLVKATHVNSATITGNGQVVMILDVPNLISAARNVNRTTIRRHRDKPSIHKRILVVDDSITTRELERSILEAQGYQVELADDGTIALDMLNRNNYYNLVITDVEMPNMNGFELTSRIRSLPALRALPVIIVTSLNNDEQKRQGIEAGANAYITKGDFEQANLLTTIEYLTS